MPHSFGAHWARTAVLGLAILGLLIAAPFSPALAQAPPARTPPDSSVIIQRAKFDTVRKSVMESAANMSRDELVDLMTDVAIAFAKTREAYAFDVEYIFGGLVLESHGNRAKEETVNTVIREYSRNLSQRAEECEMTDRAHRACDPEMYRKLVGRILIVTDSLRAVVRKQP